MVDCGFLRLLCVGLLLCLGVHTGHTLTTDTPSDPTTVHLGQANTTDTYSILQTSTGQTGQAQTSYTDSTFPHPRTDYVSCGQQAPSYVCDPSNNLTTAEVQTLDNLVETFSDSSVCLCPDDDREACGLRTNHVILIGIVPQINSTRTGYYSGSNYHQSAVLKEFASHLFYNQWALSDMSCAMLVVIILDLKTKLVYTKTDTYGSRVITSSRGISVGTNAKIHYFMSGQVAAGLEEMLTSYKEYLAAGPVQEADGEGGLEVWQIVLIVIGSLAFAAAIGPALGKKGGGGGHSRTGNSNVRRIQHNASSMGGPDGPD